MSEQGERTDKEKDFGLTLSGKGVDVRNKYYALLLKEQLSKARQNNNQTVDIPVERREELLKIADARTHVVDVDPEKMAHDADPITDKGLDYWNK
jgi:hypothetical protein